MLTGCECLRIIFPLHERIYFQLCIESLQHFRHNRIVTQPFDNLFKIGRGQCLFRPHTSNGLSTELETIMEIGSLIRRVSHAATELLFGDPGPDLVAEIIERHKDDEPRPMTHEYFDSLRDDVE